MGIYIGLGANLDSHFGSPKQTLEAAIDALEMQGVRIRARSRWFKSAAIPDPGEPEYTNGVVAVESDLSAENLLRILHDIEKTFGRERRARWESRPIDLDLLDYHGLHQRAASGESRLDLPHPRIAERAFVLLPLFDIAPEWRHPVSGEPVKSLISALPPSAKAWPLTEQ